MYEKGDGYGMVQANNNVYKNTDLKKQFEDKENSFYTPENKKRLLKSIRQLETIGGTVHDVKLDD